MSAACQIVLRNDPEIVTLLDAEDYEWASRHRWHLNSGSYAARSGEDAYAKKFLMHREIVGLKRGGELFVDHINRNTLDNRRSNLRIVTHAQNHQNCQSRRGSASKFRGVHRKGNRWVACGTIQGQRTIIGNFRDELDAALAAEGWRGENMPFAAPDSALVAMGLVPAQVGLS